MSGGSYSEFGDPGLELAVETAQMSPEFPDRRPYEPEIRGHLERV